MDIPDKIEAEILEEIPYNAADKTQVNNARKKEARLRKEELAYVKAIMSTPQGRRWMYNMIVSCKTFGNPIIQGDTHLTYSYLGAQNIGKKLLQDINDSSPENYMIMIKESKA